MMINKAHQFLDKIFAQLKANQIELVDWPIDHLCYRTSSLDNYKEMKKVFSQLGVKLVESDVNGRAIATYKLHKPINYKNYVIPLIEVPAPKAGRFTAEGFEHIEVVIDIDFPELMRLYPHCQFEKKAMYKKLNPELEIEFGDCAVKFHHQSLEEIIRIEQSLK